MFWVWRRKDQRCQFGFGGGSRPSVFFRRCLPMEPLISFRVPQKALEGLQALKKVWNWRPRFEMGGLGRFWQGGPARPGRPSGRLKRPGTGRLLFCEALEVLGGRRPWKGVGGRSLERRGLVAPAAPQLPRLPTYESYAFCRQRC